MSVLTCTNKVLSTDCVLYRDLSKGSYIADTAVSAESVMRWCLRVPSLSLFADEEMDPERQDRNTDMFVNAGSEEKGLETHEVGFNVGTLGAVEAGMEKYHKVRFPNLSPSPLCLISLFLSVRMSFVTVSITLFPV